MKNPKTKPVVVDQPRCQGNLNGAFGKVLKFKDSKRGVLARVDWDDIGYGDEQSWELLKDIDLI